MRRILLPIFSVLFLVVFLFFLSSRPVQAVDCSYTVSDTTIAPGESFTVTINANPNTSWNINLGTNDPVPAPVGSSGSTSYTKNGNTIDGTVVTVEGTLSSALASCSPSDGIRISVSSGTSTGNGGSGSSDKDGVATSGYTLRAVQDGLISDTLEARQYLTGNAYGIGDSQIVTENTRTVHITFTGLVNKEYTVCLSSSCLNTPPGDDSNRRRQTTIKIRPTGTTMELAVCGDGQDDLKLAEGVDGECEESDYFWAQHIYSVVLYPSDSDKPVMAATFYVAHYYPLVSVSPSFITSADKIRVFIKGTRRPHGKGDRNNYKVELARADSPKDILYDDCTTVEVGTPDRDDGGKFVDIPDPEIREGGYEEGDYIIKINEQANESGLFGHDCNAEFTYYWIKLRVRSEDFWNKYIEENKENDNVRYSVMEIIPDPNGTDIPGAKKKKGVPLPPCKTNNFSNPAGTCPEVMTGLGMGIRTQPGEFVGSVFSLVLGIAGGLAVVLIIFSGYRMIVSQGNPEKLEEARQQLVSAIVGLLFLILALVLIQVIGFDILKIPGFK